MEITRISILGVLLICFGCRDNKYNIKQTKSVEVLDEKTFQIIGTDKEMRYYLPDTIQINDTLKGHLIYHSEFDEMGNDDTHVIDFHFAKTDSLSNNFEEFKRKRYDTYARIRDSIIPIYDITFEKKGSQLFEGYIRDYLFIDRGNDSIQIKTSTQHVMYNVYVK
ncbi:hypothetical protein [Zobellia sp. 1_MG-2023]|uniref:hypothetical protein n=1 Tax=Zobellia sp. 1_MG-2023 TaxID=3062626 RepID=UPI0026E16E2D|nr:hypothetical protein [Zobellia sp. 1_MG-2023]MDO6818990.1 hypothetical protein [Zobellia sp. 1_MG-2023]